MELKLQEPASRPLEPQCEVQLGKNRFHKAPRYPKTHLYFSCAEVSVRHQMKSLGEELPKPLMRPPQNRRSRSGLAFVVFSRAWPPAARPLATIRVVGAGRVSDSPEGVC